QEWDRRPGPAILPPGWMPPERGTPALRYDRPVPRQLVHKGGIDEVFVTDSVQVAHHRYALAAELPLAHCHFNDLPAGGARFDMMPILELCRQAGYVVIHRHLGVPIDRQFLLGRIRVELAPDVVFADQPDRLWVATSFTVERLFDTRQEGVLARL